MPPLRLTLRREWVGQRGQIDPVALAAIEDRLDDIGGDQCHAQNAGQAGDLAVNLADQTLYSKSASSAVVQVEFGNLTSAMVTTAQGSHPPMQAQTPASLRWIRMSQSWLPARLQRTASALEASIPTSGPVIARRTGSFCIRAGQPALMQKRAPQGFSRRGSCAI